MTTPVSAVVSSSSNSSPRWGRSGEPGSAFTGLTRPGRGGRGRGGYRGGRGGRGNPSVRESKVDDTSRPNKTGPPVQQTKPTAQPPLSALPSSAEKPTVPAVSTTRPKPPSRRASHVVPPMVNTQIPLAEVASAPTSARPSNRRRRSQAGKSISIPSKIIPPASNDDLLRPNKSHLAPVSNTAPIKDAPPHLNSRFDMRHDIDVLVERVRAVAMDNNRPATPGSHIDWAGDDDDSLPDLDDWGVKTTAFATNQSDIISPIIVDGLRPLPDIANSITSSPLRQVVSLVESSNPVVISTSITLNLDETSTSGSESTVKSQAEGSELAVTPITMTPLRKSLHPSLPAKPTTVVPPSKLRSGPTPMRSSMESKTTLIPGDHANLLEKTQSSVDDRPALDHPVVTADAPAPTSPRKVMEGSRADSVSSASPGGNHLEVEGLAASMHAPKPNADSMSAPANMSTYSTLPKQPRDDSLTHTRAHTAGRPFPKSAQADYNSRFPRHLQSHGGSQQGYHSRTHSSPQAGGSPNQHRSPVSRPVITGDAISRLARTIGKSSVSPKPQSITVLGD